MSARRIELALKKQMLLLECASQRQQLAQHAAGLQPAFATAERGIEVAQWLRDHIAIVTALGVTALAFRPRRLWRLGLRGFYLWRMVQSLRSRR